MGYVSNFLPYELSKLDNDVTIVVEKKFLDPYLSGKSKYISLVNSNGITKLKISKNLEIVGLNGIHSPIGPWYKGLKKLLRAGQFDIVQSLVVTTSLLNIQLVLYKKSLNFDFYLQDHSSKSVFTPSRKGSFYLWIFRKFIAPYFNKSVSMCFIPSSDIFDVVHYFYGLSTEKTTFEPLGVNSDWFHYPSSTEKAQGEAFLKHLGVPTGKFLVTYAGRLTSQKGADFLSDVIAECHSKESDIIGVFIGKGSDSEIERIRRNHGCHVFSMVPANDLPLVYWGSDLGVWPREGSTSILDSLASGLPTIVRSGLTEIERKPFPEWVFTEESHADLVRVILSQFQNYQRQEMGAKASKDILENYSWADLAKKRLDFYFVIVNQKLNNQDGEE